jgi:hypothetical protein
MNVRFAPQPTVGVTIQVEFGALPLPCRNQPVRPL